MFGGYLNIKRSTSLLLLHNLARRLWKDDDVYLHFALSITIHTIIFKSSQLSMMYPMAELVYTMLEWYKTLFIIHF